MNNRKKNILLGVLIVGIVSMTVAFAALTTRLNIGGTANIAATKWNIRFEDWTNHTAGTVNNHNNTAVYPDADSLTKLVNATDTTKITGLTVTLNQPGDYAEYYFKIANRGTIDAKLDNFTYDMGTTNSVIDYTVACYTTDDRTGTAITTDYVLTVEHEVYCKLKVQYIDQENSHTAGTNQVYQQGSVTTSLSADWTWVQADGSSSVVTPQTGGQSGGNEPVASGDYKYYKENGQPALESWYDSLEAGNYTNAKYYLRKSNTTGDVDVCGVFNGGTVCINDAESYMNNWDYADPEEPTCNHDENDECIISGYVAAKRAEFEPKGATCTIDEFQLDCTDDVDDNLSCTIANDGGVACSYYNNGDHSCNIITDVENPQNIHKEPFCQ